MSFFRDAVSGGADCGPSNPLQNLMKHSEQDPTARHDRFAGPAGPGAAGPSMRRGGTPLQQNGMHDDAAERFFGGAGPAATAGRAFEMDALRRELESQMQRPSQNGPSMEAAWTSLAQKGIGGDLTPDDMAQMERSFGGGGGGGAAEAAAWRQHFMNGSSQPPAASAPVGVPAGLSNGRMYGNGRPYIGGGMGMGMMGRYGMAGGMYGGGGGFGGVVDGGPMMQTRAEEGKGKGKVVELSDANWEAEFARIGADQVSSEDKEKASEPAVAAKAQEDVTLDDIRNLAKEDGIDPDGSEADGEFLKSLERTWKNLQATMNASTLADSELAQWEAQYGGRFADPDADDDREMPTFTPENVGDFLLDPKPYPYQEENPFLDHPDPFAEGQRLLATGEPLSRAALAFEAACQKEDHRAWRVLGETQAADEKEHLAIRAFEKAVELASPEDRQAAWLALAISWVNECEELRALATLERWLQGTYPDAVQAGNRPADASNPWDRHTRVVDMFLAAARAGPVSRSGAGADAVHGQPVDADVQVGLGVLFYANGEHDHAKDCFEAALGVNPSDFLLWNRLGATLANGGSPEHAIDAYRKALELRPTFTRAIYNLGVSCLNVGCFQEAAEHLLAALSLHRRSEEGAAGSQQEAKNPLLPDGDGSDNLWHTLRRAFLAMERHDLAERAKPGADVESFRKDGFEF